MNKTFLFSVLGIIPILLLSRITSGGLICFYNPIGFVLFIVTTIPILLISGLLRDFIKVLFSSKTKIKSFTYIELKNSYEAVNLVIATFLILGLFLSLSSAVALIFNWDNLQFAGPNLFSLLTSLYYAFLLSFILIPVDLQLKLLLLSYMDEESEVEESLHAHNPTSSFILIKVFSIIFLIALPFVYLMLLLKNEKEIFFPFNLLSILLLVLTSVLVLFSSGAFSTLIIKKGASHSLLTIQKKSSVLKNFVIALIFASVFLCMDGSISILNNLEDKKFLVPTLYISFLPMFYSLGISLLLLPLISSLNRKANTFLQA